MSSRPAAPKGASTTTAPASPLAARPASPWPAVAAVLALLAAGVLLLYLGTAAAIVEIWSRSGTFTHGFLVPPLVLWLIWRRRADVAAQPPRPAPWVLLPMAAAGVLWLLGELASTNVVSQFALAAMLALLVPAVAGVRATRAMLFPLGFLFFAVPFGEFLTPWLMVHTADFTVSALRATGIPVYREGMQFVIPSGTWSVVEACSGVRYLIASLMVGTLFAYLNYRSMWRRWVFVGVAIAVPIVANWLRAYFIVLLGHYSGNRLAVGVDHLVYGWVFFGIVVMLMFTIGMRWAEPPAAPDASPAPASRGATLPARAPWPVACAAAVVLVLPVLALQFLAAQDSTAVPRLAAPSLPAAWAASPQAGPELAPAFHGPSAEWQGRYLVDGHPVGVYLGYYRHQDNERKLVSSTNGVVKSNDPHWIRVGGGSRAVSLPGGTVTVRTATLRPPVSVTGGDTLAAWQLYWINGTWTASDSRAKALAALYRLMGRGDDAAVLVLYTPHDGSGHADERLAGLLRQALPAVEATLRSTRDGR